MAELIARLKDADPQAPVVITGANGGFDAVLSVSRRPLKLNVNSFDGFGPHDVPAKGERPDIVALAILCEPAAA